MRKLILIIIQKNTKWKAPKKSQKECMSLKKISQMI